MNIKEQLTTGVGNVALHHTALTEIERLEALVADTRNQALEDAAVAIEEDSFYGCYGPVSDALGKCIDTIRALKTEESA